MSLRNLVITAPPLLCISHSLSENDEGFYPMIPVYFRSMLCVSDGDRSRTGSQLGDRAGGWVTDPNRASHTYFLVSSEL